MDNNFDVERELDELYQEVTLLQLGAATGAIAISVPVALAIKKQIDKSEKVDKEIEKEFEEVKKGKSHKKLIASLLISTSAVLAGYLLLKSALKKQKEERKMAEIDSCIEDIKIYKNELRKYLSKSTLSIDEYNYAIRTNTSLTSSRCELARLIGKNIMRKGDRIINDYSRIGSTLRDSLVLDD